LGLWIFDTGVDVIFIIDIVLGFFTTYFNTGSGDEIWSPKHIAKRYLIESFLIDFLSTLPVALGPMVEVATSSDPVKRAVLGRLVGILGMFKIVRVRRISKMISNLNQSQELKAQLKRLNTIFILFIYVHALACILWYFFKQESVWVPPLDFMYVVTDLFKADQTILH